MIKTRMAIAATSIAYAYGCVMYLWLKTDSFWAYFSTWLLIMLAFFLWMNSIRELKEAGSKP